MSASIIQISEPKDYSTEAINIYSKFAQVIQGDLSDLEKMEVIAVVIRLGQTIDQSWIDKYPKLKFVISPTTGLSHFDTAYCKKKGIRIFSLQDCQEKLSEISATAELTLGLIICLARHIPSALSHVKEEKWERDLFKGTQLYGKTLGILGLGRLGSKVASYAATMGMKILAFDSDLEQPNFIKLGLKREEFNVVLKSSDIITLHANETADNKNLIDQTAISEMKRGVLLINTSRGSLVDEDAILENLINGHVGGFATDVLATEHQKKQSKLIEASKTLQNLLITPHIGGCTSDSMHQTELIIARHFEKHCMLV